MLKRNSNLWMLGLILGLSINCINNAMHMGNLDEEALPMELLEVLQDFSFEALDRQHENKRKNHFAEEDAAKRIKTDENYTSRERYGSDIYYNSFKDWFLNQFDPFLTKYIPSFKSIFSSDDVIDKIYGVDGSENYVLMSGALYQALFDCKKIEQKHLQQANRQLLEKACICYRLVLKNHSRRPIIHLVATQGLAKILDILADRE